MNVEHRSQNEIAYDIVKAAPHVEQLVEEWFATLSAVNALRREFYCVYCLRPAPDEWGTTTRCPKHPKKDSGMPRYMQTCDYAIGGGSLPDGTTMPTAVIGNVPRAEDDDD
jgi:hypothetical protein